MSEFRSGDLVFDLRLSARRKTVEITVKRDGRLVLDAPEGVEDARIFAFIEDKRSWVYRKLAEREVYGDIPDAKRYLDGEGFSYLGRTYRLRIVDGQKDSLRFDKGRFFLAREALPGARTEFIHWYEKQARTLIPKHIRRYSGRMQVFPEALIVQDLGFRWGSCGKGGRLYFHWKVALLPQPLIEYIVVHEMAHLIEPHHTPEFWLVVERAMPDYATRRTRLESTGKDVEGAV